MAILCLTLQLSLADAVNIFTNMRITVAGMQTDSPINIVDAFLGKYELSIKGRQFLFGNLGDALIAGAWGHKGNLR